MGIRNFIISISRSSQKYYAGETVSGGVHFELDSPRKVRGVFVKMKGRAKVEWTQSKTHYSGEHEFFNEKIYFVGEEKGESFDLEPGNYNYKFDYVLPVGLPSSFEGTYGGITYSAKAVLDIPFAFDDEAEIILQMIAPVDLNTKPQAKQPVHIKNSKYLHRLWCKDGPLTVEVNLPKSGYVPGEFIEIQANVDNLTSSRVLSIACILKEKIEYHVQNPSHYVRKDKRILFERKMEGVPPRHLNTYAHKLLIPQELILNFENCSVFSSQYILRIKAYMGGFHRNFSTDIPLNLGTVPLQQDEPSAPFSILPGLGTPYPYEHVDESRSQKETNAFY